MPTNVTAEYTAAEEKYHKADSTKEKINALKEMLSKAPSHKGAENLRKEIKTKISKLKDKLKKEAEQKKGAAGITVAKKGAAQIVLVGTPNSGKSTLLNKLTGTNVEIANYPYTTSKPEEGMLDYKGIKLQIVEIPAVIKNFDETENGRAYLGIIKQADLIVLLFKNPKEKELLEEELKDVEVKKIIYKKQETIKDKIWENLDLIKVHTKEPGKEPSYPPFALEKESTIKDMAKHIHKDFIKKFRFARIWGKSAKHNGQRSGIEHQLKDDDIVELHMK